MVNNNNTNNNNKNNSNNNMNNNKNNNNNGYILQALHIAMLDRRFIPAAVGAADGELLMSEDAAKTVPRYRFWVKFNLPYCVILEP